MQVFAKSDIGRERKTNEDFYYVSKPEDKIRLFILADGMGGYNAGEVASRMAVESARDYIHKHFAKNKDSKEKLEALERKENSFPPIKTASAPYKIATFSFSKLPAGASNSGFLTMTLFPLIT